MQRLAAALSKHLLAHQLLASGLCVLATVLVWTIHPTGWSRVVITIVGLSFVLYAFAAIYVQIHLAWKSRPRQP